ncbi:hypothetical protein B0H14DRAFT_3779742 [Mycena olivaceomarginata]|nr:hypothetical protein B0H14DRAFT_3779742 [Mycena olivaceomarginata]
MPPRAPPATRAMPKPPKGLRAERALNPGAPGMPKPKRSSAQVQADKDAKADEKRRADKERREGIVKAAAIENRMVSDDKMEKILRPRPEKPTVEEEPKADDVVDPCSDGPGSSDEYQPAKEKSLSESEEEVMDASDDEPVKPAKKGRTKKPPKGSLRRDVEAERIKQGGTVAEGKRKMPAAEQVLPFVSHLLLTYQRSKTAARKKAKTTNPTGIRVDWSRGRTPAMEIDPPARSRSASSGFASFASYQRSMSSDAGMPPASDSSAIGGIGSDVDDGEEAAYAVGDVKAGRVKVTSLAGIVDTDAPGLVGPSARRKHGDSKIKKAEIKLTDIPDAIRPQFKTKFTPRLLEHAGRLQGWADPSDQDMISIWNRTFPDYALSTSDSQDKEMVLVVTKLAQDKVDTWRNKIANGGIAAWTAVFHKQSKEEIATDVAFFLDGTDQSRNFYYPPAFLAAASSSSSASAAPAMSVPVPERTTRSLP